MAKKSFSIDQDIAANSTVNVLQASRFQNVSFLGLLTLAELGAATGLTSELFVSDRNSMELSPVPFTANPVINIPENIVVDDVECFPGDRIQLNITNGTGAAVRYTALLILDDNVAMNR